MTITAKIIPNGPLVISGEMTAFELIGEHGSLIDIAGRPNVVLCRCGASFNKPFCDGTHSKLGHQVGEAVSKSQR